jgi:hypothetical protein
MGLNDENITFFLNEKDNNDLEMDLSILQWVNDFEVSQENTFQIKSDDDNLLTEINNYELNYTVKQLLIICDYYNLLKQTRNMKKQEIISLIIMFESTTENYDLCNKRKKIWMFMNELKNDKIMNKFIIWN